MPGHSFEDEAAVEDTFKEFERNLGTPGNIERHKTDSLVKF